MPRTVIPLACPPMRCASREVGERVTFRTKKDEKNIEKKIFFSNNYLSTQKVISRYIDQLEPEDNQNKLFALRHLSNLYKGTCYAKKWRKYLHSVINSDQPLQNIKNFDYRDKNEERKINCS